MKDADVWCFLVITQRANRFDFQYSMKSRHITFFLATVTLLLSVVLPCPVRAQQAGASKVQPAVDILSVWSLSQSCGNGVKTMMRRSPEAETIRQTGRLSLPGLDLKFRVWQHPDSAATSVRVLSGDRARRVIDHYIFLSANDLADPVAAVVITELGAKFDTTEKVLAAAHKLESRLAERFGASPTFERISGPYGTAIEMIVPDRISSACFPTSDFHLASETDPKMIGISRFVFLRTKLIEFSLVLKVPNEAKSNGERAYAKKVMDDFWQTVLMDQ